MYKAEDGGSRAEWSIRSASGHQELYYKVDMMLDPFAKGPLGNVPPQVTTVEVAEPYATAMDQVLTLAEARSSDGITLTRELLKELGSGGQNAELLAQYRDFGPAAGRHAAPRRRVGPVAEGTAAGRRPSSPAAGGRGAGV
ncbi:UUP1 family membrane protein [Oceanimonas sp. NS1]|nr:UUP1 family membrane protein [Oceanimonas sp. NS1]